MVQPTQFHLKGQTELTVEHQWDDDGTLHVRFIGGYMGRYNEVFENYLKHLDSLVNEVAERASKQVHCHLENFGEALSRTQHAIYRMLNQLRGKGVQIVISASRSYPENAEHLRMAKIFVESFAGQPGPKIELTELN